MGYVSIPATIIPTTISGDPTYNKNQFIEFDVGGEVFHTCAGPAQTSNVIWTKILEITMGYIPSDTLSIKFEVDVDANGYAQIYKNNIAIGTERHLITSGWTGFIEVIAGWTAGDLLQIYGKRQSGTNVYVRNLQILHDADVITNTMG